MIHSNLWGLSREEYEYLKELDRRGGWKFPKHMKKIIGKLIQRKVDKLFKINGYDGPQIISF